MAKYLIEIEHDPEPTGCGRTITDFIDTSAREFKSADWGCKDHEHKAWLVIEAKNRDVVKKLIPPRYRPRSTIVQLSKFLMQDEDAFEELHK